MRHLLTEAGYSLQGNRKTREGTNHPDRLEIDACHFLSGTSKWNKIEHPLICHLSRKGKGKPLEGFEVIVNRISRTATQTGLQVHAKRMRPIMRRVEKSTTWNWRR